MYFVFSYLNVLSIRIIFDKFYSIFDLSLFMNDVNILRLFCV